MSHEGLAQLLFNCRHVLTDHRVASVIHEHGEVDIVEEICLERRQCVRRSQRDLENRSELFDHLEVCVELDILLNLIFGSKQHAVTFRESLRMLHEVYYGFDYIREAPLAAGFRVAQDGGHLGNLGR